MTLVLAESRRALLDGIKAEVHAAGSETRRSLLGFESLTNYVMTSALLLLTN